MQNTRQAFPYTLLLVNACTRSWKIIEVMQVSAWDPATSSAWYSRTPRMRRGPSTNICTPYRIWEAPSGTWAPQEFEFYRNNEQWLQVSVSDRSAHQERWRDRTKLEAGDTKKARMCRTWAGNNNHIHDTSSPCKIKHVRFDQHSKTVPDGRSWGWAELLQLTKVFRSNPEWKTQCKDLPNSVEHPNHCNQKLDILSIFKFAQICPREYQLLWCLSNEPWSSNQQVTLTSYRIPEYYRHDHSAGDVYKQKHDDKEDKHDPRSLKHGMQPNDHDDLHHISVESISLRYCNSPPRTAGMTTYVPFDV
jgi:hypothetical protein